ncbi:hypothetical protein [Vibrio sp. 10N.261.55.A7]|uniref:hypothetical protein n=1 Tax=Vibrio sp. 10N.261.55.A7 TaxID=1880851 RepID=UPI000C82A73B|nr:hypothetical protein [Vibrio sp. 10N.261.55.A7]PMJ88719.1 hypothetical protein BCU12_14620 [Vibrio sp. 10N.261.55.A7]
MKNITKSLILTCSLMAPMVAISAEHNHSHNHFNPALEQLGNDIIGLTVCYKNGYLSDEEQEPAFTNLISHADVSGEELGMFYMDKLGPKAEEIMGDKDASALWTEDYCSDLTQVYLDTDQLAHTKNQQHDHSHDHGHSHGHNHGHSHGEHVEVSAETLEHDIQQGRLLSIQ